MTEYSFSIYWNKKKNMKKFYHNLLFFVFEELALIIFYEILYILKNYFIFDFFSNFSKQ
jgi:hypothetical protein